MARFYDRQSKHEVEVIVCGDAAVSFEPAAEAAVQDDVLALRAGEGADRLHDAVAVAPAVTRRLGVHMTGVQTEGAMVTLAAA
jgi:hypothetical protein